MATPEYVHGKKGRIKIDGVSYGCREFSAEPEVDSEDTSNTESGDCEEFTLGWQRCTGEVGFIWDTANDPTTDPPDINIGSVLLLQFYPDKDAARYFNVAKATVMSAPLNGRVEGGMEYRFRFRAQGGAAGGFGWLG